MTNLELKATAELAGRDAFAAGKKSIPFHDVNCMNLIENNDGEALTILIEWQRGWTNANIAKQI